MDEDRPRPVPAAIQPGADLTPLSVEEIEARIALLEGEIVRLQAALVGKKASRSAADAIFKL